MIHFRLAKHKIENVEIVEIFDDEEFIGVIYPGGMFRDSREVKLISKFRPQMYEPITFSRVEQHLTLPLIYEGPRGGK